MSKTKHIQEAVDKLKNAMGDSEWQAFIDSSRDALGDDTPLDQFEWVILKALKSGKQFEFDKPYDLEQRGKGFKSGKIQLIRDTRDSKIFISSFHVDRGNGTNKLANITLYKYERKRNDTTSEMEWHYDCKLLIDNSSERNYPINKLLVYLKTQLSLDGHKLDSSFAKVIEGKSETELLLQADILEKIKNLEDSDKLNEIVTAVADNNSIVISAENYQKLIQSRYNEKNLSDYEKDLLLLRSLIDSDETTETDMQKFLGDKKIDRSWIFGLDYVKTFPKFNPGLPCEYDFLIRRFNLVFDIVEMKSPNAEIIELLKTAEREKPDPRKDYAYTSIFGRALHQVIEYLQQYEQHFSLIEQENPSVIDFRGGQFPRGMIVMSKRSLINNNEDLHKLNRQFSSVEVLTYDDLYDRAENIIKFIRNTVKEEAS